MHTAVATSLTPSGTVASAAATDWSRSALVLAYGAEHVPRMRARSHAELDPDGASRCGARPVKGILGRVASEHVPVRASDASHEISCAVLARVAAYSAGAVSTASATASPIATAVSAAPLLIKAPGMTADTPSPT